MATRTPRVNLTTEVLGTWQEAKPHFNGTRIVNRFKKVDILRLFLQEVCVGREAEVEYYSYKEALR